MLLLLERIRQSGGDHSYLVESSRHASDRGGDLRRYFIDAGFTSKPEEETFGVLGQGTLGNIEFVSVYVAYSVMHQSMSISTPFLMYMVYGLCLLHTELTRIFYYCHT